jgi:hypothetical protein
MTCTCKQSNCDGNGNYIANNIAFHRWLTKEVLGEDEFNDNVDSVEHYIGRTFTTWNDYGAVVEKMKEKKIFDDFVDNFVLYNKAIQTIELFTDKDLFFTTLQEWWEKEIKK